MRSGRVELHGELFVTLETAAACYQVEVRWVEEVYATGVLGHGEQLDDAVLIAEAELDRLASIVRWHRHHGLELEAVVALYGV